MAEAVRARTAPGTATALTALGAGVLVLAGSVGPRALVVAVLLIQLAVAATWHALLRSPGERWGALVGLAAGVVATAVVAARPEADGIGELALVAVGGLFAAFGQRLLTVGQGREHLVALLATTSLVLVEALAACWIRAGAGPDGAWVVAVGALGAALAVAVVSLAGTSTWAVLGAVVGCAVVGAALGGAGAAELGAGPAGIIAGGAGLAALCGAQVRRLAGRSARTAPATVAGLPLALAAPATYALARIVGG